MANGASMIDQGAPQKVPRDFTLMAAISAQISAATIEKSSNSDGRILEDADESCHLASSKREPSSSRFASSHCARSCGRAAAQQASWPTNCSTAEHRSARTRKKHKEAKQSQISLRNSPYRGRRVAKPSIGFVWLSRAASS